MTSRVRWWPLSTAYELEDAETERKALAEAGAPDTEALRFTAIDVVAHDEVECEAEGASDAFIAWLEDEDIRCDE